MSNQDVPPPEDPPKPKVNSLRAQEERARRYRRSASVALLVVAFGLAAFWYAHSRFQPRDTRHHPVKVEIRQGLGSYGIGEALRQSGVINDALAFDIFVRWRRDASHLLPGRYTLSPDMTLAEIDRQLKLGPGHSPDDRVRLVIPEGFTLQKIAARLQKDGITSGAAFLQQARHPEMLSAWNYGFPRPNGPLEGYLYPDTYEFFPNTPPEKVLDAMLLNFSRRFVRPYQQQIVASGRTLHEIVTIASLIEREAKEQQDRPRIAGVLDNRLKQGMKLEIDATVLYALGVHKQRVYYKDLRVDSPYNTYLHAGLPPGPIASPGLNALEAALQPEKNDYLYYVARPNGSHIFTRTLADHEAAKKQAKKERQSGNGMEELSGG